MRGHFLIAEATARRPERFPRDSLSPQPPQRRGRSLGSAWENRNSSSMRLMLATILPLHRRGERAGVRGSWQGGTLAHPAWSFETALAHLHFSLGARSGAELRGVGALVSLDLKADRNSQ